MKFTAIITAFALTTSLITVKQTTSYTLSSPINKLKSHHAFSSLSMISSSSSHHNTPPPHKMPYSRRDILSTTLLTTPLILLTNPEKSHARLDPVDRPDLLPTEPNKNVIQIEKFLTKGQAERMDNMLAKLEKDTGWRVRVLCQSYPQTPGLAIRDYWDLGKEGAKDDKYVVLVVDQFGGKGNVLNFNVGEGVKFALPNVFWTRLQGKYGSKFFVKENGIDLAIVNAVEAITSCLRSAEQYCVNVPDEGLSMKGLGF